MDPEPKALRPFILVATFFVIFGCVAAYFFWLLGWNRGAGPSARGDGVLHAVPFLLRTSPRDRERLEGWVASLKAGATPSLNDRVVSEGLAAAGEEAVPPLLDALYRLSLGNGFDTPEGQSLFVRIDRVLEQISQKFPDAPPPLDASGLPDRESAEKRADAWFLWWEARANAGWK